MRHVTKALLAFEWTSGEPGKSLILKPDGEEPDEETLLNTFRGKSIIKFLNHKI